MKAVLLCVTILGLLPPLSSVAFAERRCDALGGRCICSEPFNTTAYTRFSTDFYNPVDDQADGCTVEPGLPPGTAVARILSDVHGGTDPAALAALPAGHQVNAFMRAADGHLGVFLAGQAGFPNKPRIAARWYLYHTPDFEFAGDGACENSKLLLFGNQGVLDKSFGPVHMYNFLTWSVAKDCCFVGPGPQNITKDAWRGKWYRVEVVVTNPAGPGTNVEVYLKNVTDNAPEIKVVDLSEPCPGCGLDGGWAPSATLTPPTPIDTLVINLYRQGICKGWLGVSHYVAAAWDTNAAQRIGPAAEVEPAAFGTEQRCDSLGADCLCSAPLNASTYTRVFSSWYEPEDDQSAGCTVERGLPTGTAIARNNSDVSGGTDTIALAALPAGHDVQAFLRAADGHLGLFYAGHASFPNKPRIAARWYLYHTPDFEFAGDGGCLNSGLSAFGSAGQGALDKSFGQVQMANFLNWSAETDCCWRGPGPQTITKQDWRGKWYRVEVVVTNPAGPGTNVEVYLKNVTDNGPELRVVDLSEPCPGCGPGTGWLPSEALMPPAPIDSLVMNLYRQGSCTGWLGVSHYVATAWDTNAAQRIGPAVEIEPVGRR
jgi:hypothetical protein